MNKDNSKYLLMLYQHCKDFREFFLESDYKNVFHSLYKIIKNIIDIDNICGLFLKSNYQDHDYFSIQKSSINENNIPKNYQSAFDFILESLSHQYYVHIVPIQSHNTYYGCLFFCKAKNKINYTDEEKNFLEQLGKMYSDIFDNKDTYQRKIFNQSIVGQILNNIKANVYITNPHTDEILYVNNQMKDVYQLDHPIGQKCWQVFQKNQKGRCLQCPVNHLVHNPQDCVIWEEHSTSNQHIYQNYDSMVEWFDHSLVHFQYSIDITHFKDVQNKASYDDLTGIYNRRAGKKKLSSQIEEAKKENKNIIVCLFDLDHLKTINDTYGHQAGDFFIKTITDTVSSLIHKKDLFFRLSGDEFIISFYDNTTHQVNQTMLLILNKLKTIQNNQNLPYILSFCFGLYEVLPHNQLSTTDIITQADEKMYIWKKRSHLRYALNDLKIHSPVVENFDYNKDLLYNALVKSTDDYIFICNMKTGVFKYTPAMVEEFAFPNDVLTNAAAVFGAKIHKDDKYEFLNSNQQITDGRTDSHIVEYRALNKNNEYVWLRCRGHVEYDDNHEPSLFAGFISNLGRKNYRDNLTSLYNHFEFEKRINELKSQFAIMILNINQFKVINQLYDHEFGDHVLRILAQNIQTMLYNETTLFKLDGDEFGLILKETDTTKIQQIFDKIQAYASQKHTYEGKPLTCHFNAGVAIKPQDGSTYLELRRNCEIALQYSKRNSHTDLTFFNPDLFQEETYILRLQNTLKQAIMNQYEGFSLVYQPKVKANSHQLMGFEVLIRWNHPDFPQVGPGTFIPILEDTRGIIQLGNWILEQALIKLKMFLEYDHTIMISINVSYIQLIQDHFIDYVKKMLTTYQIPAQLVILELTETTIVKDNQKVISIINQLRSLGLKIAMDDFGKGSSSLSLLKDEPLDIIKIDQSFVRNIKTDSFNYSFTKFIIGFCHELNLKVVIEGVETKEELDILEEFQPDYIQGYYFSYPLSLNDTLHYLQKRLTNEK